MNTTNDNLKTDDATNPEKKSSGNPIKFIFNLIFWAYVLFFWSFMVQDGQFTILHKREPSLRNIVILSESPQNIFGALATEFAIRQQDSGIIVSMGQNGFKALEFW